MHALLLIAHGSRVEESNDEIRQVAATVREQAHDFDVVECAFLELADPGIPAALQALIDRGAERIRVVPYFLSRGKHVQTDVPGEIKGVADQNPQVKIEQAPYVGSAAAMTGLILSLAG